MRKIRQIAVGLLLTLVLVLVVRVMLMSFAKEAALMSTNQILRQQTRLDQQKAERLRENLRNEEQAQLAAQKRQNEQQLAQRKEQAWFKWYKAPPDCDSWKSQEHMVECVNHQMRAKTEFNKLWEEGKLE
jgi:flagellar motor protein MotB